MKSETALVALLVLLTGGIMNAQEMETVKLPTPALENDKLFMQTVKERKSSREFSEKELSLQDLSNVLWCANGVNRPESGKRTSPSAMNKQDVDIYVVLKKGAYLYEAKKHELLPVISSVIELMISYSDFLVCLFTRPGAAQFDKVQDAVAALLQEGYYDVVVGMNPGVYRISADLFA